MQLRVKKKVEKEDTNGFICDLSWHNFSSPFDVIPLSLLTDFHDYDEDKYLHLRQKRNKNISRQKGKDCHGLFDTYASFIL